MRKTELPFITVCMPVRNEARFIQATIEQRDAINAAQRDAQDAVDQNLVPRQYHAAVQRYFERLAGLLGPSAPQTPAAEDRAAEDTSEDTAEDAEP